MMAECAYIKLKCFKRKFDFYSLNQMTTPKKRKTWSEDKMNEAVGAVLREEMGHLKASKYFGVHQTTLERYVKQRRLSPTDEDCATTKLGRKPVIPPNLEAELIQHCLLMEERLSGSRGMT
jgi:transposase-like protein